MTLTRRLVLAFAVGAVLALVAPAAADECHPQTETPTLTVQGLGATIYVMEDNCNTTCWMGVGTYREMNGIPGLQRNDMGHFDTCGWFPPDLPLFG